MTGDLNREPASQAPGADSSPGGAKPRPRRRRRILLALGILVLIPVLIVLSIPLWISYATGVAVTRGGTAALGVRTHLEDVDVRLFSGEIVISGLEIANPGGFESPFFMRLGSGTVSVELGSLRQQKIVIPLVRIGDAELYLDRKGDRSNYQAILDHIQTEEPGETETPTPEEPEPTGEPGKSFVIQELRIENLKAVVDVDLGVTRKSVPVVIEEIVVEKVGGGGGVPLTEVYSIVIRSVLQSVATSGAGLPGDLSRDLTDELAKLPGAEAVLRSTGKALEGASKTLTREGERAIDSGKRALEKMGGFLKKKEKD